MRSLQAFLILTTLLRIGEVWTATTSSQHNNDNSGLHNVSDAILSTGTIANGDDSGHGHSGVALRGSLVGITTPKDVDDDGEEVKETVVGPQGSHELDVQEQEDSLWTTSLRETLNNLEDESFDQERKDESLVILDQDEASSYLEDTDEEGAMMEEPKESLFDTRTRPTTPRNELFSDNKNEAFPFADNLKKLNMWNQQGKEQSRKLGLSEFNKRGLWVKRCSWREGPLKSPLQGFVRVLRRVNQLGASAAGNPASCLSDKALADLDKMSFLPVDLVKTDCITHADCSGTHQPRFCNRNGKCVDCKTDDKADICDETSTNPALKPIGTKDQCFNVCPLDAFSPAVSCTLTVLQFVLLIIYYIAYYACGGPEDTGSYADSVFQGRSYKPQREFSGSAQKLKKITATVFRNIGLVTNAVLPGASYILSGLSVYSWVRGIALFFWTLLKVGLLLPKLILKALGLIWPVFARMAKVLDKVEELVKKPYQFTKKSSDEVLAKCLVPCEDPSSVEILDLMKIRNPGLYDKVKSAGLVAKPWSPPFVPGSTNPKNLKQTCNKSIKNGKAGILRKFQKVTLRVLELYYDFQIFNQLYFYFLATPIENFICELANFYADLESAFDLYCQSYGTHPMCSSSNRRDLQAASNSGLNISYAGNLWKANDVPGAIDSVVNGKIKPGVDAMVDALNFVASKMSVVTNQSDIIFGVLLQALGAMKQLTSIMEKISVNFASPMEGISNFLLSIKNLLEELKIDVTVLEDLANFNSPLDVVVEFVVNTLLDAIVPNCDNIEDCLTQLLLIKPFNLDCNCFGFDNCEERNAESNDAKDCVDLLFGELGINLDLSFLDGLLGNMDLPGIDLELFDDINFAFLDKISNLFDLPFFDTDFDPFSDLLSALELKDVFEVQVKSYRALSDGQDDVKIKFECPVDYYPVVRKVEFTKGQRCSQDLSAVFRYPCLDANGNFIRMCDVSFQELLVDACGKDEIIPFFDIDPVGGTVLSWLPNGNPFREAFNKGVVEALYICWGLEGSPPFLGEALTKPNQAGEAVNGRYTSMFANVASPDSNSDNQIFISDKTDKFEPSDANPKCEKVVGEEIEEILDFSGSVTDDFESTQNCRDSIKVSYTIDFAVGEVSYVKTVNFESDANNGNCGDCTSGWYTAEPAWPGSASAFPGSSLSQAGDLNYTKATESISGCRTGSVTGCDACKEAFEAATSGLINAECKSIDASIFRHTQGPLSQLGSTQNLLMRRQYWGPDKGSQNTVQCPREREIFVEYYEMEPCIDQSNYGHGKNIYDQGYCSFRAAMGELEPSVLGLNRFESLCTGQRACNQKCMDGSDFYACNCRDNNCVTVNGNYLHKVWKSLPGGNEFETFDEYLRSLDKENAFKNWGGCSYWMDGKAESDPDRVHDSISVEGGTSADGSSGRKRYASLSDCISEVKGNIVGFPVFNGRSNCERVFEPLADSCPITTGRSMTNYETAISNYATKKSNLENSCSSNLDGCGGQRTCDVTECTANVGVFQYACMRPEGLGGFGKYSAGFVDSFRPNPRVIVCPANSIDIFGRALYGKPFEQEDATEVFFANFCQQASDGTISCELDAKAVGDLLNDANTKGKTLRVDYTCRCGDHFYPFPDPINDECVPCPSRQVYFADIDSGCHYCPRGTYYSNDNGNIECKLAPPGTFIEATSIGAASFRLCPPYTYNENSGSTSVEDCLFPPENYVAVGTNYTDPNVTLYDTIAPCPPGFDRRRDDTQCLKCPAGYYRFKDSPDGCAPCQAGYQSNANNTDCDPCPPGYYSYEGAEICLPCNLGCYATASASTQCQKCPVGKTTNSTGQSTCSEDIVTVSGNVAYDDDASCEDLVTQFATWLLREASAVRGEYDNVTAEDAVARLKGNGICDGFPLNTPPCQYDGGDCCQSTCVTAFEREYPGGIYDFFLDFKETSYFIALENNVTNGAPTNHSLTVLIDELVIRSAFLLESNENLTDAGDAFVALARQVAIAFDEEVPENPDGYGINLTESQKDDFPFNIDRDQVFQMTDVDGDGEVEIKELVILFMELFEVAGAELDQRRLDITCQSFKCIDPAVVFADATCDGDQLVVANPAVDPDPDYCGNIMSGNWYESDPAWGDGRCDDRFNHASCGYDNGDCCIGTCVNNPCISSSCREDSFNCRDPEGLKDTQPPRLSIRQESVLAIEVEPDKVPKPLVVTASDNLFCAPPNVTYTSTRTNGTCETSYTLERRWGACDAAGNCAEEVSQTVTVVDGTPPLDQYLDLTLDGSGDSMPVICIADRNSKWISIPKAFSENTAGLHNVKNPAKIPNNIEPDLFGLQEQLIGQFQESDLRWQFYDAARFSVEITNCTNSACSGTSDATAGCYYDATDDTLYLQAKVYSEDNVYTIAVDVTDDCGNVAKVSRQIVVTKSSSAATRNRYGELCRKPALTARDATLSTRDVESKVGSSVSELPESGRYCGA